MKNYLLRLRKIFKARWGRWMLGMFMAWAVVPVIVKAIIMCTVRKSLPDPALTAANAAGVIMSVIFGILMALSVDCNKVRPYKILTGVVLPWIAVIHARGAFFCLAVHRLRDKKNVPGYPA